jgi:uncharacterized membrane protein YphA (DoxX/SURF4 family)
MFPNLKASLAPLILRLGLASIFIYHGYLEISYRGGSGWSPDLPVWFQMLVSWGNVVGGAALALGLLTRFFALWFTAIMVGAIVSVTGARQFVHVAHYISQRETQYRWEVGYEYNFAIIVICLALVVLGSGVWSLDRRLFHRRQATPTPRAVTPEVVTAGQVAAGHR